MKLCQSIFKAIEFYGIFLFLVIFVLTQNTHIVTVVLTFYVFKKKVKKHGILLMGLSETGKTLIFSRLVNDKYVDTVTSMKENVSQYKTNNVSFWLFYYLLIIVSVF